MMLKAGLLCLQYTRLRMAFKWLILQENTMIMELMNGWMFSPIPPRHRLVSYQNCGTATVCFLWNTRNLADGRRISRIPGLPQESMPQPVPPGQRMSFTVILMPWRKMDVPIISIRVRERRILRPMDAPARPMLRFSMSTRMEEDISLLLDGADSGIVRFAERKMQSAFDRRSRIRIFGWCRGRSFGLHQLWLCLMRGM